MKQSKIRLLCILTLLLLTFSLLFSFTSCDIPKDSDYVSSFLEEYGVPDFNVSKFRTAESIYWNNYVKDLPEAKTLAEEVSKVYFEKFHENIDTGDVNAVTDALLHCYVYSIGDLYSVYRDAEQYKNYDTNMSGTFYGIGVLVTYNKVEETITVSEVYRGSGAEDAGIQAGDLIVGVGSEHLSDIGYDDLINKIRGEENTTVDVIVSRDGVEFTVTATRKKVVEESVSYSIDENKIGYIKLSSFKDNTYSQFVEAIDYMEAKGAVGIIYDLRSNPGGYLNSVVNILSYISSKGTTIVSFTNDYANPVKDRDSHSLDLPSVVICNENTASAGELFTAAMRDFDEELGMFDVTVVGVKTYGKGVMQSTFNLGDGSTLTVTVAYYNPPCGENYDGIGITPNLTVEQTETGDAQMDAAYEEIFKLVK